jgi:hypothetical protein
MLLAQYPAKGGSEDHNPSLSELSISMSPGRAGGLPE